MATLGCWCIFCNEYVKQQHMGAHVWRHGWVAKLGTFPLCAPSPWSKRQGYWDKNPHPPEPLTKKPEPPEPLAPMQARLLD